MPLIVGRGGMCLKRGVDDGSERGEGLLMGDQGRLLGRGGI